MGWMLHVIHSFTIRETYTSSQQHKCLGINPADFFIKCQSEHIPIYQALGCWEIEMHFPELFSAGNASVLRPMMRNLHSTACIHVLWKKKWSVSIHVCVHSTSILSNAGASSCWLKLCWRAMRMEAHRSCRQRTLRAKCSLHWTQQQTLIIFKTHVISTWNWNVSCQIPHLDVAFKMFFGNYFKGTQSNHYISLSLQRFSNTVAFDQISNCLKTSSQRSCYVDRRSKEEKETKENRVLYTHVQ